VLNYLEKRILPMENSDAYSIIKALMEKRLLAIRPKELFEWLDRLQAKGHITEEESKDLLQLADKLKIFDLPISEQVVTAFN
jgi:hypothetical protein